MATLHIEHAITDYASWKAAFDLLAGRRLEAGVTAHRINTPADNPRFVVVQLDFPSVEQAQAFLGFLERSVWSVPSNSPGLAGSPSARILVSAPDHDERSADDPVAS